MGMASSKTVDHFAFLEDKASIAYIKESRLVVYLPGYDDVRQKLKDTYPSATVFEEQPSSDDEEENSLVLRLEKWMKKTPNDSSEIAILNHDELKTPQQIEPFSELAVTYNFVQLYPYKESSQPLIPLFYGWFFNLRDSEDVLRGQARKLLQDIGGKDEFNAEFSKYAMDLPATDTLNIQTYYSTDALSVGKTLLHCTGYFTNHDATPEAEKYHKRNAPSFGKALGLEVIGFIITPRTFGVRLKLSDEDLKLWHEEEDDSKVEGSSCKDDEIGWKPSEYSPTNGPGSRAHLTLAVREKVQAVQTGLDLEAIIKEEVEAQKSGKDVPTIEVADGMVARGYGQGSWAVYLKEYKHFEALFSNFT